MLAKEYCYYQDVTGWLMSEKLDGVRAIWTGSELVSRNGNKFFAPAWFTDQLPAGVVLDGELYVGRSAFQFNVGVVRKKQPVDAEWQQISYCVFDAPACKGGIEARLSFCADILAGCKVAEVVPQTVCESKEHLQDFFTNLIAKGAEGVMLRRPGSKYEPRRSGSLLKYKPASSDEAEVIGYQAGTGRLDGRLGALICRWRGIVFKLGTGFSDLLRESPPQIGAQVSFTFCGLTTAGVPRFAAYVDVRDYE